MTFASRAGGWLFRQRSWLPLPLVAALLLIPAPHETTHPLPLVGALIVALGEGLRFWAVLHIGAISRTRSERLGPLIASGPFSRVRNPLYLGNILLWTGFTVAARLVWFAPIVMLMLALEYHAIVRWEEQLLTARIGEPYVRYTHEVPRWLPSWTPSGPSPARAAFSWKHAAFSERGTLIAIGAGFVLLWLKARF